jgi:hypothetical protein
MNDTSAPAVPASRAVPMHLNVGVISHLIQVVEFGTITIHFEAGRPTYIERKENIRLTGGGAPRLEK